MVAEPSVRGSRLFPVVCIQLGTATRSSRIALSPAVQACALATLVAAATALVYLGISQIGYVRLISNERSALARVESANVDLEDNVANLRDRLAITTRGRAVAEDRVSVLARQADALRGQLESTETKLHGVEQMLAERQAPPPDPVAKAGPAQFVQSESAPPEANPPRSGVTAPDSSTEAKRRTEGIVELARRSIDEFQHVLASAGSTSRACFLNSASTMPKAVPSYRQEQMNARASSQTCSREFAAWRKHYPCRRRSSIIKSEAGSVRAAIRLTGDLQSMPGWISTQPIWRRFTPRRRGS